MSDEMAILKMALLLADELADLGAYVARGGDPDPEETKQITMRMMRKVSDERARREIGS